MDRGFWKLRCQMCAQAFELEVKPGERVIHYAQEAACPYCYNTPGAKLRSNVPSLWHHIIGYRAVKAARSQSSGK
jgi:hypothetical protein